MLTCGLWLKGSHPAWPGWPCPLRTLTGLPCPTCFLTRATAAALHGDLAGAVKLHAFGPAVATVLLLWCALSISQRRLQPRWGVSPHPRLLWLTMAAMVGYWVARVALQIGLHWQTFPQA